MSIKCEQRRQGLQPPSSSSHHSAWRRPSSQRKDTTPQRGNCILTSLKIGTFQKAQQYKILTCKYNSQRSPVNGPLKGTVETQLLFQAWVKEPWYQALSLVPHGSSTQQTPEPESVFGKRGRGLGLKNIRRVLEDNQYFSGWLPDSRDGGGSVKGYRVGWQKGEKRAKQELQTYTKHLFLS